MCNPVYLVSHKPKRSTMQVLRSKIMAFANAIDIEFTVKHDFQVMFSLKVLLFMMKNTLLLFDVLTGSSNTTEKRIMHYPQVVKDVNRSYEIN